MYYLVSGTGDGSFEWVIKADSEESAKQNAMKDLSADDKITSIKELSMDECIKLGYYNFIIIFKREQVFTVRSFQRTFELLQKRLHIERKGFHSLRHTFATRALECGMDVKTLAEILGHKNATVTLNRYAHSLMEHKQDMMNKLGKIFN